MTEIQSSLTEHFQCKELKMVEDRFNKVKTILLHILYLFLIVFHSNCHTKKKSRDYFMKETKAIRISMFADIYKSLICKEEQSPENLRLAYLLGWCMEVVSSILSN